MLLKFLWSSKLKTLTPWPFVEEEFLMLVLLHILLSCPLAEQKDWNTHLPLLAPPHPNVCFTVWSSNRKREVHCSPFLSMSLHVYAPVLLPLLPSCPLPPHTNSLLLLCPVFLSPVSLSLFLLSWGKPSSSSCWPVSHPLHSPCLPLGCCGEAPGERHSSCSSPFYYYTLNTSSRGGRHILLTSSWT